MSNFDLLNPALQHHIVNSLGWRELRPFQDEVIPSILAGEHHIILAPTAGGKTEAAFFPLLSRMLSEEWSGLSVLYICPIKALLNNLDTRLQRYCTLLGRRSTLWHGDVKTTARKHILRESHEHVTPPKKREAGDFTKRAEKRPTNPRLRRPFKLGLSATLRSAKRPSLIQRNPNITLGVTRGGRSSRFAVMTTGEALAISESP